MAGRGTSFCCLMMKKSASRGFLKLLVLSVLGVLVYAFVSTQTSSNISLQTDRLGPAYSMLMLDNNIHLDSLEVLSDISEDQKVYLMNRMRDGVQNVIKKCVISQHTKQTCDTYLKDTDKILTLFTTFDYNKVKFSINNKTLHNWKSLPNVNVIVFTNSVHVKYYSELAGWQVLPVTDEVDGIPILPGMFLEAKKKFSTKYYAFANGDLLFTDSLINTLRTISCSYDVTSPKGLLIVGRRTNVPAQVISNENAVNWSSLQHISANYGELFQTDAEDYFISDVHYPWDKFLPVIVGRRGYDNWVVAYSRNSNLSVIDASESVTCLHQTWHEKLMFESLTKGDYNLKLTDQLDLPFSVGDWGRTVCAHWKSWPDLCGNIVLSRRRTLPKKCLEYKWGHKISKFIFG